MRFLPPAEDKTGLEKIENNLTNSVNAFSTLLGRVVCLDFWGIFLKPNKPINQYSF